MGKKAVKGIGKVKGWTEKLDPLGAGLLNPMVDPIADQYLATDFTGAKKAAADASAERARMDAELEVAANTDLTNTNVADVRTGESVESLRKRPAASRKVSSSLGINA